MRKFVDLVQINNTVERAWFLVKDGYVQEARITSELLIRDIQLQINGAEESDEGLLTGLISAYYIAGYTVAMCTRYFEALVAAQYFCEMERLARIINDDTQLVIALTYKGDMYRRYGNLNKAKIYLQSAYNHTPQTDSSAFGNCAQLLGRIYSQTEDQENFEKVMAEAEKIACTIDPLQNSLHGQYSLGTVYVDYARHFSKLGQTQKAFDYLERAEADLPPTPHWNTFLSATRGLLLVKNGDIEHGMPYIIKATEKARERGNSRLLDHFYGLQRFLSQKVLTINEAKIRLDDALNGSDEI